MQRRPVSVSAFKKTVWDHYRTYGRHTLPWRRTRDPYKILVSEIMLQQTQVDRVIPKYKSFMAKFPTIEKLASASPRAVIQQWQGLGYNRRAVNLKRAAETIVNNFGGRFPKDEKQLLSLPGVGKATAGDLRAFAWNTPSVVIETNIRTVFIHHFFADTQSVPDTDLIPLIDKTLDHENPREWYYALMDYGSHLKKTLGNNISKSAQYKRQSPFKGSNRELRSKILSLILKKPLTETQVMKILNLPADTVRRNLLALEAEGLLTRFGKKFNV